MATDCKTPRLPVRKFVRRRWGFSRKGNFYWHISSLHTVVYYVNNKRSYKTKSEIYGTTWNIHGRKILLFFYFEQRFFGQLRNSRKFLPCGNFTFYVHVHRMLQSDYMAVTMNVNMQGPPAPPPLPHPHASLPLALSRQMVLHPLRHLPNVPLSVQL